MQGHCLQAGPDRWHVTKKENCFANEGSLYYQAFQIFTEQAC